jgi:glutaredoxin
MSEKYILYVRTDCPFCVKAISLLKEKKEVFSVLDLKSRPKVLRELKDIYEWQTVPMIFEKTDGNVIKFIGGYTDLIKRLDGETSHV